MVMIEIPTNPNCAAVDARIFHDLEPPQTVSQVRLERQAGSPVWYDVTGWTVAGTPCPALLRKVDDSGEGVAFLLSGGDAGLRLRPAGHQAPWGLDDPQQWGESFLILPGAQEVRQRGNGHG
jgi:hypothetical protein